MIPRTGLVLLVALLSGITPLQAQTVLKTLQNNPFTRPEILKRQPPQVIQQQQAEVDAENIDIELNATLVSSSAPMVIANDKLIAIGEKIGEMKLVAVAEGSATFTMRGKKYIFSMGDADKDPAITR